VAPGSSFHDTCPSGAHVHPLSAVLVYRGHAVFVDTDTVILCIERHTAERVAHLINTHGLADVPDHLPDELVWGPPITEPLIDWRLPEDPRA
jgi:hypothetical protein